MRELKLPKSSKAVYLEFLDDIHSLGVVNMAGAPALLQDAFGIGRGDSLDLLLYWISLQETINEVEREQRENQETEENPH